MKYKHLLGIMFLLLVSAASSFAQCSDWNISAQIDSATCAANGKITVTLTGADAHNLNGLQYRLEALTTGGTDVSQNSSNIFQNIRPGSYRITINGICSGTPVLKSADVTVPGNYVDLDFSLNVQISALGTCSNGRLLIAITDGKGPYTATILNSPAAYTGPKTFAVNTNPFQVNNLPTGDYDFSVTDQCGNGKVRSAKIYSGTVNSNTFSVYQPSVVYGSCDQIQLPYFHSDAPGYTAFLADTTNFAVSYKIGDLPRTRDYRYNVNGYTFKLPAGVDFKSLYEKDIISYITSPCAEPYEIVSRIQAPWFYGRFIPNCDTSVDIGYNVNSPNICGAVFVSILDTVSQRSWKDTLTINKTTGTLKNVPFGVYTFKAITADGYELNPYTVNAYKDTTNPYYVRIDQLYGSSGDDSGFSLSLWNANGTISAGSRIQLISPQQFAFDAYTTSDDNGYLIGWPGSIPRIRLTLGEYKFIVTDKCKQYPVTIRVTENDVFRYNWSYTTTQTCEGLLVTASGTATFNGNTLPMYMAVLNNGRGVPGGSTVLLKTGGEYTIGVSANSTSVMDFSPANGGNGVNVKKVFYFQKNLDLLFSLGWVCPGAAANSGSIRAFAAYGNGTNGVYTYKLAEEGKGMTGPYLDSNTTGSFTSNARYSLIKNKNYDVQITDECKSTIVRGIKILDFANFQAITADKPLFCVGDTVYFNAINLPTSAKQYTWTNPQGMVIDTTQSIAIYNVDSSHVGNYHVKITSDLCGSPIEGDVYLRVAPYITKCYSAVTDTSVNPYIHGLLGNWRAAKSYTYYGARAESDPGQQTNIRKDGAFNDFLSFWQKQTKGWTPQTSNPAWVWNAESTIFNKKSFELENKDPLGRYNAAIYGYSNAVPVAIVQNSRYREAGYEGFEDYSFGDKGCSNGECPVGRHFDFSSYINKMDATQSHTGRYSLKVQPEDSILFSSIVTDTDKILLPPDFRTGPTNCSVSPVLQSVRVNRDVLLPIYSPVAGKKILFSAWVKQAQDCHCSNYENVNVTLFVGGPIRVTVAAKPTGAIIEGWQRYEEVIDVPVGSTAFSVVIATTNNTTAYFDDIRVHPYNANMKSYVYDPKNLRLMGELDENNFATFYEYDDDGTLTRVKKETERGVKTIKETRSALLKEDGE
ncbi:MAG: hypothetical protein J7623_15940 [Chitinophaga sp.]|uniref:hypothetical protein n=1 Tax=Chitinophaga sp. TaxID=1869181 RepID=UPI001B0C428B|nr:hypothetical protein [Chitinophaga sp.]MBO9730130.1 hypothetical protein [Chitinophaga sp.]